VEKKVYVSDLVDYILDISTQYDWVNDSSEKLNIYRMVEAKFGDVYSGAQAITKAQAELLDRLIDKQKQYIKAQSGHIRNTNIYPVLRGTGKAANETLRWLEAERQRLSGKEKE
jgi:hypothetical protein